MRINHSTAAFNVARNLGSDEPGRSLDLLSSGYQIMDGGDSAAVLVVSQTKGGGAYEAPSAA